MEHGFPSMRPLFLVAAFLVGCSSTPAAPYGGAADAATSTEAGAGSDATSPDAAADADLGVGEDASTDDAGSLVRDGGPWCAPDAAVGPQSFCFSDAGTWCCLPLGQEIAQCPQAATTGGGCDPGAYDAGCFFCYQGTGFDCACFGASEAGTWQCGGGGYCTGP